MNPPTETYVGHMDQTQRGVLINLQELLHSNVKPPEKSSKSTDVPVLGVPKGIPPQPQSPPSTAGAHDPLLGVPNATQESTPRRSNRSSKPPQRYEPAMAAVNKDTGHLAEYKELQKSSDGTRWELAFCKEWGRLFQGYKSRIEGHDVIGTETCHLIHKHEIPDHKKATYIRTCADYREQKADPYRVRCTAGGNLIDFPGDKSTRSADLTTFKCLANNTISTPGARAACMDLKDFYLKSTLPDPEYVRFRIDLIPQHIWEQYNLQEYANEDGYIYARLDKGMYGLPQAGKVANDQLLPRLAVAGYHKTGVTPGLFKHESNSIIFCLVVDDFFIQYTDSEDLHHLTNTLKKDYDLTLDMKAERFCGITMEWDYDAGHVTLSMPGYVEKALQRFTHTMPKRPVHYPT